MREVAALTDELNGEAERACAATKDDVRAAERDGVEGGPVAACLTELWVEFDRCEREALDKHPDDARVFLDCTRRDHRQLVACCSAEDTCSYQALEQCYGTLWDGAQRGECDVDMAPIEAATDACEARAGRDSSFRDPCEDAKVNTIDFDAPTQFGPSPAEVFAPYAGSCSARYRLEPVGGSNTTVPQMAEGEIEIQIAFDRESARLMTPSAEGAERGCAKRVEVRMTGTVRTLDGLLDEHVRGVVAYGQYGLVALSNRQATSSEDAFALSFAEDDIVGTLRLTSSERGALSLRLSPQPLSVACEGKIWVSREDPGVSGGSSLAGWWSETGCLPGHEPHSCTPQLGMSSGGTSR